MRIEIKTGTRDRNPIMVVTFEKASNYNPEKNEWVPKINEVALISKTLKLLIKKEKIEQKDSLNIEVNKIFIEQPYPEPKVKVLIPMYNPLKTETCKKCGKVIAQSNELIRIVKKQSNYLGFIFSIHKFFVLERDSQLEDSLEREEGRICLKRRHVKDVASSTEEKLFQRTQEDISALPVYTSAQCAVSPLDLLTRQEPRQTLQKAFS